MNWIRKKWLGLFFALLFSTSGLAKDLETLEAIASKAKSLDEFLSNPELQNQYFEALQQYLGEARIPRASFDAILGQVKTLAEKAPESKAKLWGKNAAETPIVISTLGRMDQLRLDSGLWKKHLEDLRSQLTQEARAVIQNADPANQAQNILNLADRKIAAFRKQLDSESLTKKARFERELAFFKALKSEPDFRAASSWISLQQLQSPVAAKNLETGKIESVLYQWQKFEGLPPEAPGIQVPESVKTLLKGRIPRTDSLYAVPNLIQSTSVKTGAAVQRAAIKPETWTFKPIIRNFHGIWSGAFHRECVGGNCDMLEHLTPKRWAVSALDGTRKFNLERDGKYQGYIQEVPAHYGDKAYGSLDLMAPDLGNSVIVADSNGEVRAQRLFETWYQEEKHRIPKSWSGLVVGSSDALSNGNGPTILRSSPAFVLGDEIGDSSTLLTGDQRLEKEIDKAFPSKGFSQERYSDSRMIYESGSKIAGSLVKLGDPADQSMRLQDPKWIAQVIRGEVPDSIALEARIYSYYAHTPIPPEIKTLLIQERDVILNALQRPANSTLGSAGRKFLESANPSTLKNLIMLDYEKPATPEAYLHWLKRLNQLRSWAKASSADLGKLVEDTYADFLKTKPSFEQLEAARKIVDEKTTYLSTLKLMMKGSANASSNLTEYQRALNPLTKSPSDDYKSIINEVIQETIHDSFFKKGATPQDAEKLIRHLSSKRMWISTHLIIAREGMKFVKTPDDYLSFIKYPFSKYSFSSPSDAYVKNITQLTRETLDTFFSLSPPPSPAQVKQLRSQFTTISMDVDILKKLISSAKTKEGLIDLLKYRASNPNDDYKKALDQLMRDSAGEFERLELSIPELSTIRKRLATKVNTDIALMEVGLKQIRSPQDYMDLIRYEKSPPSENMVKARTEFIQRTLPNFAATNPSRREIANLIQEVPSLESEIRSKVGDPGILPDAASGARGCGGAVKRALGQLLRR